MDNLWTGKTWLSSGFSVRISSKLQCRSHAQVYSVNTKLILCGFAFGVCACVCVLVCTCVLLFHSTVFWNFCHFFYLSFFHLIFVFLFYEDEKETEGRERKGSGGGGGGGKYFEKRINSD